MRVGAGVRARLAGTRAAVADPELGKLLFSWGVWVTGDWAFLIAVSVLAYAAGGPAAVGLVGAARVLPWALLSGVLSGLSDRLPRPVLLAAVHAGWTALSLGFAAMALADPSVPVLLGAVAVGSVVNAVYRPTQQALLPQLVRSPSQLITANSAYATIEGAGTVLGPGLCALLLAQLGPVSVFAILAALNLAAAVAAARIRTPFRPVRRSAAAGAARPRRRAEALEGLRLLTARGTRTVWVLFMAQTTMRGFLNVFVILLATAGPQGSEARAGTLFAAIGVGGLVGALFGIGAGGRSATRGFAYGVVLWGLPVLVIGIWPTPEVAWVALAVLGFGNLLEDTFGFSLLGRLFPDHVSGRAWGAYYSFQPATVAVGSLAAPVLVGLTSLSAAMIVTGALVALVPVVLWRSLRRVDAMVSGDAEEVEQLRSSRLLAPLSLIALERLARAATAQSAAADETVVRQGERGTDFFVVVAGELTVRRDEVEVRRLRPGDAFGEIALLEAVPRTASVVALAPSRLLRLESATFVAAVTGHEPTDAVVRGAVSTYRTEDTEREQT